MKKILFLCMISLICVSCGVNTNNVSNKKDSITTVKNIPSKEKTQDNKALLDDMFRFYCNISAIRSLYTIAPESDYYKALIENNDIQAQKLITTILLSKRMVLGQDELKETLVTNKGKYPRTIGLLLESDKKLVENFEGVNKINTVEEFKNNLASLGESVEIYSNIPSIFEKEYTLNQDYSGAFLLNGELLCNNHTDISFWNDRQVKNQNIISNVNYTELDTSNKIIITGTINSSEVDKVVILFSNSDSSFPDDKYILSKYKKGDNSFKYNAFRKYEVFDYGTNIYTIEAYQGETLLGRETLQLNLTKEKYNNTSYYNYYQNQNSTPINTYYSSNNTQYDSSDYDDGYEWAEENDIDNFDDCDDEFGAGYGGAEDGCNKYVQENYYHFKTTFGDYECTEDCSGHEAGYNWAEEKGIYDEDDCDNWSMSFQEGCLQYVNDNN